MTCRSEGTADKIGSRYEWAKHLRPWGKRSANKRARSRARRVALSNVFDNDERLILVGGRMLHEIL